MGRTEVLVAGAGVAGPVVAHRLAAHGYAPVVVDRTTLPRHGAGGHAVDLFGPAVDVVERMGALPEIRAARTGNDVLLVERPGRRSFEVDVARMAAGFAGERHVEILRGDLARILHARTRDDVEYVFGDGVVAVTDDGDGVVATLESGTSRRFDLAVGADGLHSTVRRSVFGAERQFVHPLGAFLAVGTVPNRSGLHGRTAVRSDVDRVVVRYPVGDGSGVRAVLLFRHPGPVPHHRDGDARRALVRDVFGGTGTERLAREVGDSADFYFDAISQVRMGSWTRGRVALVGDAAHAPGAAVGGGTSAAVVGAHVLVEHLAAARGDHRAAFPAYEAALRSFVRAGHRVGPARVRTAIPRSRGEVARNATLVRAVSRLPARVRRALSPTDRVLRDGLTRIDIDAMTAASA